MKSTCRFLPSKITLITAIALFTGCQDQIIITYDVVNPVYMSYDELRSAVTDTFPQELTHPGKIYIKDNHLYVNEVRKGIHVIDNSNPSFPQIISFIQIPGNVDLAVKDNILYADSYVDLVAIDISDLNDIDELARFEDVFNYSVPPYEKGSRVGTIDESRGVVVDWQIEEVTEDISSNYLNYPEYFLESTFFKRLSYDAALNSGTRSEGNSSTGTGGSMARFIIYENILYTIDQSDLYLFDITDNRKPISAGSQSVGWNIETVFIYRDHLFIGSMDGMHIYDLSDPVLPEYVSSYWHVTSCDPVVVEGNYAYVTLRTGNTCEGDVNQLDVVNVANLKNPYKMKSYPMTNPHGLGIDEGTLFICDGEDGLKIFDATDPYEIKANMIAHFQEINTYDVIPIDDLLIMIGKEGIFQYDYSSSDNITLLSTLPIFSD